MPVPQQKWLSVNNLVHDFPHIVLVCQGISISSMYSFLHKKLVSVLIRFGNIHIHVIEVDKVNDDKPGTALIKTS